jgi:UDP-N-acetylmuramoyl-L-alanyl-D-glutamate--2,6-diaminopimelate ligase
MRLKKLIKKFIPSFLLDFYHYSLAALGAFLYGFPSRLHPAKRGGKARKMKIIGVTGTKGKSTVVELTNRILEEAGYKTAFLSSIKFKIGEKEEENKLKMTTPGRMKIQRFLRQARNAGCEYAILEMTSEGIKQYRHKFIDFDAAVLTNLSPEHIEAHKGFENYRKAKGELFKVAKGIHIVNLDDENAEYFLRFPADRKYGYSADGKFEIEKLKTNWKLEIKNWKFIKAANVKTSDRGIEFTIDNIKFRLSLLGGFNVYNALAAVCVGLSQGISLETSRKALEKVKGIPGRMEIVVKEPFTVIVDYAHTPDSLEKVYQTVRNSKSQITNHKFRFHRESSTKSGQIPNHKSQITNSKLICVLGSCGGGRDKWKRPVLGRVAAEYCDKIIVANEDPYDENPMEIIEQVAQGTNGKAKKILDRREAIKEALKMARDNDVVIITGKGSEPWMCVKGGRKIPWDDRQIVREELRKNRENKF